MRKFWWTFALASAAVGTPTMSQAVTNGVIQVTSFAEREVVEVKANGQREIKRERVRRVTPNTEVIFTTRFQNTDSKPVGNIVINNPIPDSTAYWPGSAFGNNTEISASSDKGQTFLPVGNLSSTADKPYTHIRWNFKGQLRPGEAAEVGFRALVK